jgi:hypothetical protein
MHCLDHTFPAFERRPKKRWNILIAIGGRVIYVGTLRYDQTRATGGAPFVILQHIITRNTTWRAVSGHGRHGNAVSKNLASERQGPEQKPGPVT